MKKFPAFLKKGMMKAEPEPEAEPEAIKCPECGAEFTLEEAEEEEEE